MQESHRHLNDAPLVSLIVPCYNYAHFLKQAIHSAWEQTWRPMEIIAIDDGSTDGSLQLLKELSQVSPVPMTVLSANHSGVSGATSKALHIAKGEFVGLLHADDWFMPEKIAKQVQKLQDNPHCTICHTEYLGVDQFGNRTGYDSSLDLPPAVGQCLKGLLLLQCDIRSMTILYRRSSLADGYDHSLPVEDWQSILRLASRGSVAHVDEPLVFRRAHTTNISYTYKNKKKISPADIAENVITEVCPPDLDIALVCTVHTATVIKNTLANGAWRAALHGVLKSTRKYPQYSYLLVQPVLQGLISFVWIRYIKSKLSTRQTQFILSTKTSFVSKLSKCKWQSKAS